MGEKTKKKQKTQLELSVEMLRGNSGGERWFCSN